MINYIFKIKDKKKHLKIKVKELGESEKAKFKSFNDRITISILFFNK